MSGIKKVLNRNHAFQCLTRHAGKGQRDSIKRLHKVNEEQQVVETYADRHSIERELKKHNTIHFQQAHHAIACKDKICKKLRKDETRNKVLNGDTRKEDCDDERVHRSLKLLKVPSRRVRQQRSVEITTEKWKKIVMQSKKRSTSSMFSKRTYATYKCALGSDRMPEVLTMFYNLIIKIDTIQRDGKNSRCNIK